jgi:hypothetical protein
LGSGLRLLTGSNNHGNLFLSEKKIGTFCGGTTRKEEPFDLGFGCVLSYLVLSTTAT